MLIPSRAPHPIWAGLGHDSVVAWCRTDWSHTGHMRVHTAGPSALLAEVADTDAARSLAGFIRERCPGILDVVPAARTVLFDGVPDRAALRAALRDWHPGVATRTSESVVTIPVRYDGPDLAEVARHWRVSVAEVVARHSRLDFVSAFGGFSPGFSYLSGLPAQWAVPRLSTPRTRVPPGAVAVADTWCAVYPQASPGGWRILGFTSAQMWDPTRSDPALVPPGTRVRFVEEP
jgi:KipI family sensor histidine kinase inhibitor